MLCAAILSFAGWQAMKKKFQEEWQPKVCEIVSDNLIKEANINWTGVRGAPQPLVIVGGENRCPYAIGYDYKINIIKHTEYSYNQTYNITFKYLEDSAYQFRPWHLLYDLDPIKSIQKAMYPNSYRYDVYFITLTLIVLNQYTEDEINRLDRSIKDTNKIRNKLRKIINNLESLKILSE